MPHLNKKKVLFEVLQSHYDSFCWKIFRKNEADLLITFLQNIKTVLKP